MKRATNSHLQSNGQSWHLWKWSLFLTCYYWGCFSVINSHIPCPRLNHMGTAPCPQWALAHRVPRSCATVHSPSCPTESGFWLHHETQIQMFINFIFLTWECLGLLSAYKLPLECHWIQNISLFHLLCGVQAVEEPHLHQPQPFWGMPYFSKGCFSSISYLLKVLCTWSVGLPKFLLRRNCG